MHVYNTIWINDVEHVKVGSINQFIFRCRIFYIYSCKFDNIATLMSMKENKEKCVNKFFLGPHHQFYEFYAHDMTYIHFHCFHFKALYFSSLSRWKGEENNVRMCLETMTS